MTSRRGPMPVVASAVLASAVLAGGCSGGGSRAGGPAPGAPSVTGGVTASSVGPSPASTIPGSPSTTTGPIPGGVLPPGSGGVAVFTGAGAMMTPPTAPTVKAYDGAADCPTLIDQDQGFTGDCSQVGTGAGTIAAVTEERSPANQSTENRVLIYHRVGSSFSLALRYSEKVPPQASAGASARIADVNQDGDPKAVVSFRNFTTSTSDSSLRGLDVVEASGVVVMHVTLNNGVARQSAGGGLEVWSRLDNTSPLRFHHQVIRYIHGAWRAEVDDQVAATSLPPPTGGGGSFF